MPDLTNRGPDSLQEPHPPLMSFDIDCGMLVSGHRVLLTGLSDDGWSRNDLSWREQEVACQMVSLEYDLVPGVPAEQGMDGFDDRFVLRARYHADVDLPWTTAGYDGFGPGGIEMFAGGSRTHGTLGPWPVPEGARLLTFTLLLPPASRQDASTLVAGRLDVDLVTHSAQWTSADT